MHSRAKNKKTVRETAHYIHRFLLKKKQREISFLIGKKGQEFIYEIAVLLLEKGYRVTVHPLFQKRDKNFCLSFLKKGGKFSEKLQGVLIDALGENPEEKRWHFLLENVEKSHLSVLSIDLPSGLNGRTGEAEKKAIRAEETIVTKKVSIGLFLHSGWNLAGKIRLVSQEAPMKQCRLGRLPTHFMFPQLLRNRHKYQAGSVAGYSGSSLYKGAAKLAGMGALRSGAGIVRIFFEGDLGETPWELICQKWTKKAWQEQSAKAGALFLGPGIENKRRALSLLSKIRQPCVLDAAMLQKGAFFPKDAVLTPHRGEAMRLLGLEKQLEEKSLFKALQHFVEEKKVVLVLKGGPTWIFSSESIPVIIPWGDPGMATAGTGDILTGIIAGLLAQKLSPFDAAVLGASLHAIAGSLAAKKNTSYGMIASDLLSSLPQAYKVLAEGRQWRI